MKKILLAAMLASVALPAYAEGESTPLCTSDAACIIQGGMA
jgi:hypothetical protein